MSLHPDFPTSPYSPLIPEQRWFPSDEALRSTAYEKLLPPLVAKVRQEVFAWRDKKYPGGSATSVALLRHWFETEHLIENADGSLSPFRYCFAQREALETVIWLFDVRRARDKYDLLRFDASGAVSSGMFDEDWPRNGWNPGSVESGVSGIRGQWNPGSVESGVSGIRGQWNPGSDMTIDLLEPVPRLKR